MMGEATPTRKGRRQLITIALLFLAPVIAATLLQMTGAWQPDARINNGVLIEPPVELVARDLDWLVERPDVTVAPFTQRWWLVQAFPEGCDAVCTSELIDTRQVWLRLGRHAIRVQRLALMPEVPDTLVAEHPDLMVADSGSASALVETLLSGDRPSDTGVLLVDPRGVLLMYYRAGYEQRGLLDDLKRLLRHSRIG